jgi:hypothetical protein
MKLAGLTTITLGMLVGFLVICGCASGRFGGMLPIGTLIGFGIPAAFLLYEHRRKMSALLDDSRP